MSINNFVSRILTNDLLYDLIFYPADPCSLVRVSRTCRAAHVAVHSHIARTFKINTHFARYFRNPLLFRSLQAATGTLVSGSNALQFLARTSYPASDLDLYCSLAECTTVGLWLLLERYRFVPYDGQAATFELAVRQEREPWDAWMAPYLASGVSAVYNFVKPAPDAEAGGELKVQIVVASDSPLDVVLRFHSSTCSVSEIRAGAVLTAGPQRLCRTSSATRTRTASTPARPSTSASPSCS